ncbi:hypothetical protein VCHA53O466_50195 [Vibrio chagasii]|nr:hypothetical protein VCHA53O466_50195 [Vibrio chagasii]
MKINPKDLPTSLLQSTSITDMLNDETIESIKDMAEQLFVEVNSKKEIGLVMSILKNSSYSSVHHDIQENESIDDDELGLLEPPKLRVDSKFKDCNLCDVFLKLKFINQQSLKLINNWIDQRFNGATTHNKQIISFMLLKVELPPNSEVYRHYTSSPNMLLIRSCLKKLKLPNPSNFDGFLKEYSLNDNEFRVLGLDNSNLSLKDFVFTGDESDRSAPAVEMILSLFNVVTRALATKAVCENINTPKKLDPDTYNAISTLLFAAGGLSEFRMISSFLSSVVLSTHPEYYKEFIEGRFSPLNGINHISYSKSLAMFEVPEHIKLVSGILSDTRKIVRMKDSPWRTSRESSQSEMALASLKMSPAIFPSISKIQNSSATKTLAGLNAIQQLKKVEFISTAIVDAKLFPNDISEKITAAADKIKSIMYATKDAIQYDESRLPIDTSGIQLAFDEVESAAKELSDSAKEISNTTELKEGIKAALDSGEINEANELMTQLAKQNNIIETHGTTFYKALDELIKSITKKPVDSKLNTANSEKKALLEMELNKARNELNLSQESNRKSLREVSEGKSREKELKEFIRNQEERHLSKVKRLTERGGTIKTNSHLKELLFGKPNVTTVVQYVMSTYPHVQFSDDIDSQLNKCSYKYHNKLLKFLILLCENYYETIRGGNPDSEAKNILGRPYSAGESDTVTSNERLRSMRKFTFNNTKVTQYQHLTIGSSHSPQVTVQVFFDITPEGILRVGYIGQHLETGG